VRQGRHTALLITREELRECHCGRHGHRRLDQCGAAPHRAPPRISAVKLGIDDFDRISKKTPVLADLKPWGNFTAPEMYEAGGMPLVGKRLLEAGLLHKSEKTVSGKTIGDE
jgi:hypothetical protein